MRFNSLIPELSVTCLEKSLDFYVNYLGFKAEYERSEDEFAFLSFEKNQIMIQEINGKWKTGKMENPFGRGINLQMEVSKIMPILRSLKKFRYPLFEKPKENWYRKKDIILGCREFLVQDPDGYLLRFSEDIGTKKDPAKRNNLKA